MEEIANRFKEEYTELLSRYKDNLTNAQIMSILQSVTRKLIGFKDNPERFPGISSSYINELDRKMKRCFKNEWHEGSAGRNAVAGIDLESNHKKATNYLVQSQQHNLAVRLTEEMNRYPKSSPEHALLKAVRFGVAYGRSDQTINIHTDYSPEEMMTRFRAMFKDIFKEIKEK